MTNQAEFSLTEISPKCESLVTHIVSLEVPPTTDRLSIGGELQSHLLDDFLRLSGIPMESIKSVPHGMLLGVSSGHMEVIAEACREMGLSYRRETDCPILGRSVLEIWNPLYNEPERFWTDPSGHALIPMNNVMKIRQALRDGRNEDALILLDDILPADHDVPAFKLVNTERQ